jgi:hypothetical protein
VDPAFINEKTTWISNAKRRNGKTAIFIVFNIGIQIRRNDNAYSIYYCSISSIRKRSYEFRFPNNFWMKSSIWSWYKRNRPADLRITLLPATIDVSRNDLDWSGGSFWEKFVTRIQTLVNDGAIERKETLLWIRCTNLNKESENDRWGCENRWIVLPFLWKKIRAINKNKATFSGCYMYPFDIGPQNNFDTLLETNCVSPNISAMYWMIDLLPIWQWL